MVNDSKYLNDVFDIVNMTKAIALCDRELW